MQFFKISPLLLLIIFSYCLIQGSFYPLWVLLFSMLHEAGHLLAICLLHGDTNGMKGKGQGFEIRFSGLSYRGEFLAAAAGPLTNLLLFLLLWPIAAIWEEKGIRYCAFANFLLMLTNLLPVYPLDGGRMLSCLLALRFELETRLRILQITGICCLLPLLAVAFWQFLSSGYNISLLLICIYLATLTVAQSKGEYP